MRTNVKTGMDGFLRLAGFIATVVVIVMCVNHFRSGASKEKKIAEALSGSEYEISAVEIQAALTAIGEFATAEYTYSGQAYEEKSRKLLGISIPLTEHSFSVAYDGVIKFGFPVDDIGVEISGNMIILTLPEPVVLDNYISNYKAKEDNNLFNPISSNEVADKLEEVKALELEKKNVKLILAEVLGRFEGYSVTFR